MPCAGPRRTISVSGGSSHPRPRPEAWIAAAPGELSAVPPAFAATRTCRTTNASGDRRRPIPASAAVVRFSPLLGAASWRSKGSGPCGEGVFWSPPNIRLASDLTTRYAMLDAGLFRGLAARQKLALAQIRSLFTEDPRPTLLGVTMSRVGHHLALRFRIQPDSRRQLCTPSLGRRSGRESPSCLGYLRSGTMRVQRGPTLTRSTPNQTIASDVRPTSPSS